MQCYEKGRRLAEAYPWTTSYLQSKLDEVNDWAPGTFFANYQMHLDGQSAFRWIYGLTLEKLDYLNRVPWLLARLLDPGVKAMAIQQFEEVPIARHHPLTIEFLDPQGELRMHVGMIDDDGNGYSPLLGDRVLALQRICMNDAIAEGPHAQMTRQMSKARGSSWAFHSASVDIKTTLKDIGMINDICGADLQTEWSRYSSVIRCDDRYRGRPVRVARFKLYDAVYKLGHVAVCSDDETSADDNDDDDAPPAPGDAQPDDGGGDEDGEDEDEEEEDDGCDQGDDSAAMAGEVEGILDPGVHGIVWQY